MFGSQAQLVVLILDLLGVFAFALSGALVGVRKEFDIFGVLVLAGATGLGGGILRDVMIGAVPPAALSDWWYLLVPIIAGLITFVFHRIVDRLEPWVLFFDALGLGLFCAVGTIKALGHDLALLPAVLMGVVTAAGGGMVRDLLAHRVPIVFRGELYAIPALAGAVVTGVGVQTGLDTFASAALGLMVAITWRLLALRRGWTAPVARHATTDHPKRD
ncbi:trimeric intracellular cation channel family protein [Enemella sp. A6]|uniref:trimeric intracellular cation channel family protein n=1 Tax=Enemella sp. A6 TaxID=3440152 RepID=UPI003EBB3834